MRELEEGQALGARFRLIRLLGRGGMGEVWLAEDGELGEEVALKILDPELAGSSGFVELLRAECRKARGLVHPNIVRVYDFHTEADRYFISMQYVDGRSLSALRGAGLHQILTALLPVADALEYAHQAGIIHRDIKATNILRDTNENTFLTDFGIAAALNREGSLSTVRTGGSLPAMSPQQLAGEPPTVADDVYSFGSLIFELVTGAPLFHPDVTPDRVEHEMASALAPHRSDIQVPEQLEKLVAAMLHKSPAYRPAGMAAVRTMLEEIREDLGPELPPSPADLSPDSIRPLARRRRTAPADVAATGIEPIGAGPVTRPGKATLPGRSVLIALGVLIAVAIGVIFILPRIVENRLAESAAETPVIAEPSGSEVDGDSPEVSAAAVLARRRIADEALGDLLVREDALRELGVEIWGGREWADARRSAETGDDMYRDRNYGEAATAYRQALQQIAPLEARAPEVLSSALREGTAAIEAGDQVTAVERFELALAVDANNAEAIAGRDRALQLNLVLDLMSSAAAREVEREWSAALEDYRAVLKLDPKWKPAAEALQRVQSTVSGIDYESNMSIGYASLAKQQFEQARGAFERALRIRQNDADASAALVQVESERKLSRILSLRDQAQTLEVEESWNAATEKYQAILVIDSTVQQAQEAVARTRQRAELDQRMNYEIANPDRLNDDAVWKAADQLLKFSQSIEQPGAVLSGQIERLQNLLRSALIPVPVQFQSDNLTEVVIYKVGQLGVFVNRTLELKPGEYVAVGKRDGYRDVRRNFRVVADGSMLPVIVRCEEPI